MEHKIGQTARGPRADNEGRGVQVRSRVAMAAKTGASVVCGFAGGRGANICGRFTPARAVRERVFLRPAT